jgi:hypothetical protein
MRCHLWNGAQVKSEPLHVIGMSTTGDHPCDHSYQEIPFSNYTTN